ncbi:MAG: AsmA-like C-terminal region-containing protein, partial [Phycisphaerae bacterium]|nr:AsmA-like C-terminal region-containing protein [Phycisphaerae bacterium]
GRGNAQVTYRRSAGDAQGRLHTTLEMTGTNVLYAHFPYPIHVHGGRIEIDSEKIRFEAVRGRGINGGTTELGGSIDLPSPGDEGQLRPLLVLAARKMPLDRLLAGVLSGPHAKLLADLHLAGEFDADTLIQLDDEGELDVHTELGFADASVTPGGGRFTVSGLAGKLTVARGRLHLPKMVGSRGETRIEIEAEADWTKPKRPWLAVRAQAKGLDFQDPIIDLVGAGADAGDSLDRFWKTYKPAGRFDAEVAYRLEGDAERDYLLTLRPTDLAFDYGGARVKLTETSGLIRISPERVEIEGMAGRFPAGRAAVSGNVKLGDEVVSTLRIEAEADELNATTRCFLPPNVVSVIDGLKIRGAYSVQIPRFVHRPGAREGVETDFSGVVQVRGAAFELGVDVRDFDGSIRLSSSTRAGESDAAVEIEVDARRMQVAGRQVEDFHARMQDRGPDADLVVHSLRGRYAQGRIVGKGAVDQDSGDYQIQLALTDAELWQMLRDQAAGEAVEGAKKERVPGALAASLSVQGNWRDAKRLRGRGDLRVRHGDLTGLPLAFGLLQISHLNMPVAHRFHNAGVSYYLQDGRIVFEHLELNSRSLQLAGSGTMDYPGGELNLALTTVNPRGMNLGALTDLINGVRNQLVTIRVTGTLDKPVTRVESFTGLTGVVASPGASDELILPRP